MGRREILFFSLLYLLFTVFLDVLDKSVLQRIKVQSSPLSMGDGF